MAKKKVSRRPRAKTKTVTRTVYKKAKSSKKKSYKKVDKVAQFMAKFIGAAGYGAAREKVSQAVADFMTSRNVPAIFGEFTDEVVMIGLSTLAEKYGVKVPMIGKYVKKAGEAGQIIEGARLGEGLANMFLNKNGTSNTSSSKTVNGVPVV